MENIWKKLLQNLKIRGKEMLKGKSVIELTDVRTNRKEIYEDEKQISVMGVFYYLKLLSMKIQINI